MTDTITGHAVEVIPPELADRLRALAEEAEALLPVIDAFAEKAWRAIQDYEEALDPIFDFDEAGKRTGFDQLFATIVTMGSSLASATDCLAGDEPTWMVRALAERAQQEPSR